MTWDLIRTFVRPYRHARWTVRIQDRIILAAFRRLATFFVRLIKSLLWANGCRHGQMLLASMAIQPRFSTKWCCRGRERNAQKNVCPLVCQYGMDWAVRRPMVLFACSYAWRRRSCGEAVGVRSMLLTSAQT